MKNHSNRHERENPSPHASSPNASSTSSSSSSNNGVMGTTTPTPATAPPTPQPQTPKASTPRSIDSNPYPTTFVQADSTSFKQVVQMLTGSAETAAKAATGSNPSPPPPSLPRNPVPSTTNKVPTGPKKPAFKLYERRSSMRNLKIISPLVPSFISSSNPNSPAAFSPMKQPEILSPSMLDFPSLVLSPVTPLIRDPFDRPPHRASFAAVSAEDRAIAEKGFYLHPSPRTTPRDAEPPRLLPLFPVISPRLSSGGGGASSSP